MKVAQIAFRHVVTLIAFVASTKGYSFQDFNKTINQVSVQATIGAYFSIIHRTSIWDLPIQQYLH